MLNLLLATAKAPTGAWPSIINWVQSFIGNYGWTIIFITVILKLIMLPLDFWMKFSQKKMTFAQSKIQPELEAIQKRYAYDKNILTQKQSEVYKKHGVNPMGSCLPMLLNLVIVFTVFISLVNSLTSMSNYKMQDQFYKLQTVYEQTYNETYNAELGITPAPEAEEGEHAEGTQESAGEEQTPTEPELTPEQLAAKEKATTEAENAVLNAYKNEKLGIKDSFLWIKNIWRKDTSESVIPKYKDVSKVLNAGLKAEDADYVTEEKYNAVMVSLNREYGKQWNGYYILAIISIGATILSAFLTQIENKKNNTANLTKSNWTMQIVMIIIMGVFCFISSSSFALYLAASQVISVISMFITTPLVNLALKHNQNKKDKNGNKGDGNNDKNNGNKVSYSRY